MTTRNLVNNLSEGSCSSTALIIFSLFSFHCEQWRYREDILGTGLDFYLHWPFPSFTEWFLYYLNEHWSRLSRQHKICRMSIGIYIFFSQHSFCEYFTMPCLKRSLVAAFFRFFCVSSTQQFLWKFYNALSKAFVCRCIVLVSFKKNICEYITMHWLKSSFVVA